MAIQITGTFEPTGDFPLAKAKDVEMPNGTRLSDFEIPEGKDGVSPVIVITKIDGGHTITIKDASGTHSFNVMDGKDGKDGEDGQGASITVDSELSETSENPVQNKVLTAMFNEATMVLRQLYDSIPTDAHINSLIDEYIGEALGGEY